MKKDSIIVLVIICLSIIVPLFVALLLLFPDVLYVESRTYDFSSLPFLHAVLNGSTAALLVTGFLLIKNQQRQMHKIVMLTAFVLSTIFLVSYVISKLTNPPVHFGGEGFIKTLYFFILISHIILSIPVLPLAMFSIYRGITGEFERHKEIVKWTFPIWIYVAITGVLVYVFMIPYY